MEATLRDWLSSFREIIIRPSQIAFVNESQKAKGKIFGAIGWLLFIAAFDQLYVYAVYKYVFSVSLVIMTFLVFPLVFLFLAFCIDTVYCKVFHHKNTYYDEFLYIAVAIFVPFQILSSSLSLIPTIGIYLGWASIIYPIILLIVAVKSLTKLKTWETIVTVVLSIILALAGFFCIPVFLLSIMRAVPRVF
jgi:hypothetical protein